MQLTLNIEDVNDNAPVFTQEKYEAKLMENQEDFNPPLFLEALDDDLNGMRHNFTITKKKKTNKNTVINQK